MADSKEWNFALANGGWWLVIDNIEDLLEYNERELNKYGDVLINPESSERNKRMNQLAEIYAENNNESIMFGIINIAGKSLEGKIKYLDKGQKVYINSKGGYNGSVVPERIITRKNLVFPDFKKEDIRISQWGKGQGFHYYAYVGDIEVKVGDCMKWDTYEEAYQEAMKYVSA